MLLLSGVLFLVLCLPKHGVSPSGKLEETVHLGERAPLGFARKVPSQGNGATPAHFAAAEGHAAVLRELLSSRVATRTKWLWFLKVGTPSKVVGGDTSPRNSCPPTGP